ncbi:MAG: hypothetical protein ABI644_03245 [Arenimonas sp.]
MKTSSYGSASIKKNQESQLNPWLSLFFEGNWHGIGVPKTKLSYHRETYSPEREKYVWAMVFYECDEKKSTANWAVLCYKKSSIGFGMYRENTGEPVKSLVVLVSLTCCDMPGISKRGGLAIKNPVVVRQQDPDCLQTALSGMQRFLCRKNLKISD